MKIVEYQSKRLCKANGIPVPINKLILRSDPFQTDFSNLEFPIVLKSQVNAINRGKFGGICLARNISEARNQIVEMFTHSIEGKPVLKILAEELIESERGYSITIAIDPTSYQIVLTGMKSIQSNEKGQIVNFDKPEIFQFAVNPLFGITKYIIDDLAISLEVNNRNLEKFTKIITGLWNLYDKYDAEFIELNPLVLAKNQNFYLLGVQIVADESALFRQEELCELIQHTDLEMKNEFWQIGCDHLDQPGDVCVIGNDLDHSRTLECGLQDEEICVGELIGVNGNITSQKIESLLDLILRKSKAKIVYLNLFTTPYEHNQVISGINAFLKSHKVISVLVVRLKGHLSEITLDDLHTESVKIARSIEEAKTIIEDSYQDKK